LAAQPPIHLLPGLRLAESWTGPEARRVRLAAELEACQPGGEPTRRAILHAELGRLAERAGKLEDARAHYEAALAEEPGTLPAIWALRRQHARAGRVPEWLDGFNAEIAATSDELPQARLWVERALVALRHKGDPDEARTCLGRAIALDPAWPRPRQLAEWLEARHGSPEARLERLAALADVVPDPELRSAYRVELAWAEWRKGTPESRAAASVVMQAALEGAAAPSAVLDCLEHFAEETRSAETLLRTLDQRRALVDGASAAAKLEAQAILLSASSVAAGAGADPLAALASYRDAAALAPEPEMLPELVRRAVWARTWGVAHTVAGALGPAWSLAAAVFGIFARKPDAARAQLSARLAAAPDDDFAGALLGEIDRIGGAWTAVSADLEERLVHAPTDDARVSLAVEVSEIDAELEARRGNAVERLRQILPLAKAGVREDAFALLEELYDRDGDTVALEELWRAELTRALYVGDDASKSPKGDDEAAAPRAYLAERLCDAAVRAGDYARAAEVLATADGDAARRAALLEEAGHAAAALEAHEDGFREAKELDAGFAIALRAGAIARDRVGDTEAAARWYERAHRLHPERVEPDEGLDEALAQLGRGADRAEATARTLAAIPKDERWITRALERAWILFELDRHVEALVQLEAVEEIEAGRPDVWVLRGRILERARAWGPLSEQLVRLSELEGGAAKSEWILEAAAVVELGLDDPGRALRLYVEALDADAESPRARDGVVRTAARVRSPAAIAEAIEVAERDPFGLDPEDLTELAGLAREVLEDPDRAGLVARARLAATDTANPAPRPDGRLPAAPEPATLGELSTLLGALQDAESAGDLVRGIALGQALADRTSDTSLQASLLVEAARAAEVGRGEDPIPVLLDAFARAPDDAEVVQALARHLPRLPLGERTDVLGRLCRASDLPARDRAVLLVQSGEARAESGALEEAWAAFEEAGELDPTHLGALAGAQDIALEIGEPRRVVLATERLAAALGDPDQSADAWIEAGHLYVEALRDPVGAMRCFVEADARRPGDWASFRALRSLFLEAGRAGELARLYTRQISTGEGGHGAVALHWERAVVEGWTGNLDGAERDLDAVLLAEPDHVDALEWRARLYARAGRAEQAAEKYARLLPLLEELAGPVAEQRLAMASLRVAELAEAGVVDPAIALDVLGRLLGRRPSCPETLRHAANLAARLGQWDDAARALGRLVQVVAPGAARARVAMELCRVHGSERWDQDAAAELARFAFRQDPLSLDAILALVDLSAYVVSAEELAREVDGAIAARRAELATRTDGGGLLLAELALLLRLRGFAELSEILASAARLQGNDPDRLVHASLRPSAGRGRADLSAIPPAPAAGPTEPPSLRAELVELAGADPADDRLEAAWSVLGPGIVKRSFDDRISAAWEPPSRKKPRPDDPLLPRVMPLARLLGAERVEVSRAEGVPGIALARRTVTVLGSTVLELLVDARLEPDGPPAARYRVARAVAVAMLDLGAELVRHDALVAALVGAAEPTSPLWEKIAKKERPRVRALLAGVDVERVAHWFLGRRLGLARLVMALCPHVGSAAKELGTDPERLDALCRTLGSEAFASLRERLRGSLPGA
jgi:tetratricopeptide (TPR) repeat protein